MAKANTSYEDLRKKTIEDNRKRMEALNLHQLAQAVRTSSLSPKPSPGLPSSFCRKYLPKRDETVTLVDVQGDEYPTVYLENKHGLSGGWRGFAIAHELVDGDALVFQLMRPTTFKIFIIRVES